MATRRKPIITKEEIDRLYDAGDIEALMAYNETYAKRSNERLASLERADLGGTASYNRAIDWLQTESEYSNGTRFSRSKKMDIDDLRDQLIQETDFLRSQTSTVAGEKARREKIFKAMIDSDVLDINLPDQSDEEAYKTAKERFMKFLDEDVFNELVKTFRPTDIINMGAEAIRNNQDPADLQKAYDAFVAGEVEDTDILDIFETWTGAGLHEKNRR